MKKTVKKVLAAILTAALITGCIAITAFATATEPEWTCKSNITRTHDGEGTYTFTPNSGASNTYFPLSADVTAALKKAIENGSEKVTLKVSFDYTITPADNKTPVIKEFMLCANPGDAEYKGTYFESASGVYRPKVRNAAAYPALVADGTKHTYTNEITVTRAEVEPFDKLELTFQNLNSPTHRLQYLMKTLLFGIRAMHLRTPRSITTKTAMLFSGKPHPAQDIRHCSAI